MRKFYSLILTVFISATLFSQAPEKMSYQAVIRNSTDQLVTNHAVGMRISILQGSSSGTAVYTETQTPTTNANGLVSIEIGGGSGFDAINWGNYTFFIKTETDPTGGTGYTITGISQILSVPYALHAKTVASYPETDPVFIAHPANGITGANIANWNSAYGWGNPAGQYRLISYVPAWSEITSNPFSFVSLANNQLLKYNTTNSKFENWTPNYLTSYTETEPIFVAWNKSTGININASQVSDFQTSVTTNDAVAANSAKNSYPIADQTKLAAITGTNTGDETTATIKTKLAITTLSGSNTGDQDIAAMAHTNRTALDAVSGINTGDQTLLGLGGVASNTAITGATNTKITYDTKGLVTSGTDATTADIAASTDKNYVTNAQLTVIDNTSGTNTGDQNLANVLTKGTDAGNNKIVNVNQQGIGTETPNASAALDISSTTQGFLLPRLTYAQENAISNPVAGLVIWCSDCGQPLGEIDVYNGTAWTAAAGYNVSPPITIGMSYQGGKVAYIFQLGDPAYIAGQTHGLIAAVYDQGTGIQWYNGSYLTTGATGQELGTGNANTTLIIFLQGNSVSYAAKLCRDYNGGGYTDWYLPSIEELFKVLLNKNTIGGFTNDNYWSSTEDNNQIAWYSFFDGSTGGTYRIDKSNHFNVRAIRAF